jgi:hypothetical protein
LSLKSDQGAVLVFTALSLTALLIIGTLAADVGCILTARNQLQSAVDASALAAASGLMVGQSEAIQRAITFCYNNLCLDHNIVISATDVTFPEARRVRVAATRPINMFFAKLIGIEMVQISTSAIAELGTIVGTRGMRPWALPDMGWPTGTPVVIKSGSIGAPGTNPGFFYPINFPPLNRGTPVSGADAYCENIAHGSEDYVFLGDQLQVEPGNMVGPTNQGIQELISLDPNASCQNQQIIDSAYPGYSSPRVVTIPLYDSTYPPDSGRSYVTAIGLASFFIQGVQGKDVIGIYIGKMATGQIGSGYSFLQGVHLVD